MLPDNQTIMTVQRKTPTRLIVEVDGVIIFAGPATNFGVKVVEDE